MRYGKRPRTTIIKEVVVEKDKLDIMFKLQKDLQQCLGHDLDHMIMEEKEAYTRDNFLGLMTELNDLMGEINWNKWKTNKKTPNQNKITNSINDAFHYFMNICLVWKFSSDDLYEKYNRRNRSVFKKIKENKLSYKGSKRRS
jgi:dimeric dUTPase (all-alpha-NTP-PPase superfamily)